MPIGFLTVRFEYLCYRLFGVSFGCSVLSRGIFIVCCILLGS